MLVFYGSGIQETPKDADKPRAKASSSSIASGVGYYILDWHTWRVGELATKKWKLLNEDDGERNVKLYL